MFKCKLLTQVETISFLSLSTSRYISTKETIFLFLCDLTFESHIRVPVLIDASVSMLILQLDELEKHESGDGTAIEEETKIVAKDGT